MKRALTLIVLLVAGAALWLLLREDAGTAAGPGAAGPPAPVVSVAPVRRQVLTDVIEAIGTTAANESVTVTAKVTDTVSRVEFGDGERVEEGEVLVQLTDDEESAQLAEARADLEDARLQLRRLQRLVEQNTVSEQQVDEARARFQIAEARLETILARLDDRLIRAPFSGLLGFRQVSPGTLVSPGTPITTLDDISVIKLDFSVPETLLATLEPGMRVFAESGTYEGRRFEGEVSNVGSRIDPVTRAVTVRALLPNEEGRLRPGMLMTVRLIEDEREALVVPDTAVVASGAESYVFVVDGENRVQRREIEVGARKDGLVEVLDGLIEGEVVVAEGVIKVRDGVVVRPELGGGRPARAAGGSGGGDSAGGN